MIDPEKKQSITPAEISTNGSSSKTPSVPYDGHLDDLHDLIGDPDAAGSEEDDPLAELRNDPNYSALIKELEYIAKQARLLFEPAQDTPSDDVWTKIQKELATNPTDS